MRAMQIAWKDLRGNVDVSGLLYSAPSSLRYLTGAQADDCVLLVTARKRILFASPLDSERLHADVREDITVVDSSKIAEYMKKISRCAYEHEHVSVARFSRWKRAFKNTKFVQISDSLQGIKRKKTMEEIVQFRRAQKLTAQLMTAIPDLLQPGITEKHLAWVLECAARESGADGMAFPTIVGFGSHTSRPHHHPTDRTLKSKDIVQIDMGVRVKEYCSDQSSVFFVGKPTDEQQRVYDCVLRAMRTAKSAVRAGVHTKELDQISRSILQKEGLESYFTHALGHGIGLDVHEFPTISSRAKDVALVESEIVTIEPGVYIPGKFGIRLEEEVIVPA